MRSGVAAAIAAVAIALAAPALARTEAKAKPKLKPWLGVSISDRDAMWGGVAIVDVFDDTPASLCGLRAGDEIMAVQSITVHGSTELQGVVGALVVGEKVSVEYVRAGEVHQCSTKLAEQISDPTELLHRRLVDKPLPPFSVIRHSDGAVIDDTTARGRVLVLALFSTSCDVCAQTIADVADAIGSDAGVDLLAVTADGDEAIKAFVQRTGMTVEVATEPSDQLQNTLVRRYLADRGDATIIVVDHKGTVTFAASGTGTEGSYLDGASFCVSRAARARLKSK